MDPTTYEWVQLLSDPGAVAVVGYLLSRHLDKLADRIVDRWLERTDRDAALAQRDRAEILARIGRIEAKVGAQ